MKTCLLVSVDSRYSKTPTRTTPSLLKQHALPSKSASQNSSPHALANALPQSSSKNSPFSTKSKASLHQGTTLHLSRSLAQRSVLASPVKTTSPQAFSPSAPKRHMSTRSLRHLSAPPAPFPSCPPSFFSVPSFPPGA